MAENITTIIEMREAMDPSEKPTLADLVYLIDGSGTPRDKPFPLSDIMELFHGGAASEIVLRTTGGSQEVTLTITPSSITFTKVDGQTTTTRKIDFNGNDSFLDAMRLKTLSGATAIDATQFKLVIDTVTEMLENVSIGTSEYNKNLTVHGNVVIDGAVNSNLDVGTSQNPANLNVTGNSILGSEASTDLVKTNQITAKTGGANGTVTSKCAIVQEKQSKIEGLCFRDVTNEHDGLWLASKHGNTQDLYNKNLPNGSFIVAVNDSNYDVTLQYQSSSVTMVLHPGEFKMFFRWNGLYMPFGGST
jgi:hypothetical protein